MHLFILCAVLAGLTACGRDQSSEVGYYPSELENEMVDFLQDEKDEKQANPVPVDTDEASSSDACLYNCATEPVARLDFLKLTELAWPNCVTDEFAAEVRADGLWVIALANCLEGSQVYEFVVSANGIFAYEPRIVSSDCYEYFRPVLKMSVAFSPDGGKIVYICDESYGAPYSYDYDFKVRSKHLSPSGRLGGVNELYSVRTRRSHVLKEKLFLSYNPVSQSFAFLYDGYLQRIDANGQKIGGKILLGVDEPAYRLSSYNGNWYILSQRDSVYSNESAYCSKVSPQGILECDQQKLEQRNAFLSGGGRLLSATHENTYSDKDFYVAAFNPDTCAASQKIKLGAVHAGRQGKIFDLVRLSEEVEGFLYHDDGASTLKMALLRSELTGIILSDVSVANVGDVKQALAFTRKDEVLVVYLDGDGHVFLAISDLL